MKSFIPIDDYERENEDLIRIVGWLEETRAPDGLPEGVYQKVVQIEEDRKKGLVHTWEAGKKPSWFERYFILSPSTARLAFAALTIAIATTAVVLLIDEFTSTPQSMLAANKQLMVSEANFQEMWRSMEEGYEVIPVTEVLDPEAETATDEYSLKVVDPAQLQSQLKDEKPLSLQSVTDTMRYLARNNGNAAFVGVYLLALPQYEDHPELYTALGDAYGIIGMKEKSEAAYWKALMVSIANDDRKVDSADSAKPHK